MASRALLVRGRVIRDIRDCHKLQDHVYLAILGLDTLEPVLAQYLQGTVLRPRPRS